MASWNKGKSEVQDWIRAHANYSGDECLIWPFSRSRGHGHVWINGRLDKAARVMCSLVKGPPPTPKHETAHSCGRGHDGCINPKHLSWKTRTENQRDRLVHGTAGRAETGHKLHKLTAENVAEIRAIGDAIPKEELGRRYGVTPANIAKILSWRSWKTGRRAVGGFRPGDPRNPFTANEREGGKTLPRRSR